MEIESIGLRHGRLASLGAGTSIAAVSVRAGDEGEPTEAVIFVDDGSERDIVLRPGDTFPVGTGTWRLDHVEDFAGRDWRVVVVRVT